MLAALSSQSALEVCAYAQEGMRDQSTCHGGSCPGWCDPGRIPGGLILAGVSALMPWLTLLPNTVLSTCSYTVVVNLRWQTGHLSSTCEKMWQAGVKCLQKCVTYA